MRHQVGVRQTTKEGSASHAPLSVCLYRRSRAARTACRIQVETVTLDCCAASRTRRYSSGVTRTLTASERRELLRLLRLIRDDVASLMAALEEG